MEQLKNLLRTWPRTPRYSESFKKQIVREFEKGLLNKDQLKQKYGLGGNSTVLKWCRRYGKFAYYSPTANGRPMKDPQKQRIKELEKKLKAAELKLKAYDKLIEITNRELDTDIIKKIEARLSESWRQKMK
jgi:transposase-like protein